MRDCVWLNINPKLEEEGVHGNGGGGVTGGNGNGEVFPSPYEVMFYPMWQPLRLEIELGSGGFVTTAWFDESVGREVVERLMEGFERVYGIFVDRGRDMRLGDVGWVG